tara:strand:+ start:4992 stop:5684 length:693 start_codon:yes stop_codon:yes gene_type:complete
MNILCIIHATFESYSVIQSWADHNNHEFHLYSPYKAIKNIDIDSFDWIIIMGGPQSALEINKYPYLQYEIDLIKQAITANKKVLGICLGAQLIGEAFGVKTEKSTEKEVGVYNINLTKDAKEDILFKDLPCEIPVIHWHNDMPGLTKESVVLAQSKGCPRQVIKYADKIYGFQCHFEITLLSIKKMINKLHDDLDINSKYIQSKEILINQDYISINNNMLYLLDKFALIK